MYVKVCGLVETTQIDAAVTMGYNAVGVVTYPKSKRFCPPQKAVELAQYAKGKIDTFVVGLTYEHVKDAAKAFDYVQIYEPKALPNLVFSSKERPPEDLDYAYFMYDSSVGSGVFSTFPNWLKDIGGKLIVAGGLTVENVSGVIKEINPFGVDISSGVEKNGVKDLKLMRQFIETVRQCES